jgi:NitT/TauT family transport system substrate-binding protein
MGFRVLLALAAFALLTGGQRPAQAEDAATKVAVAIGGRTIVQYLPITLADKLGYYREEGIAPDIQEVGSGTKAAEAVVGGSAELMVGVFEYGIELQPKGINLVSVLNLTNRIGLVLGLSPEKAPLYHSPADLKGLTIAITAPGSATENMLRILLRKSGMNLPDVSTRAVGAGSGAIAAVETHQVDGLILADPVITKLSNEHDLVPVVDTRKPEGQTYVFGGPGAIGGISGTASYVAAHPADMQAMVNAVFRAMKWIRTASIDDILAKVPPEFYGADKELYRQVLANNRDGYSLDGRYTPDSVQRAYQQILATGRLTAADKVDLAHTYDDQYIDRANQKY